MNYQNFLKKYFNREWAHPRINADFRVYFSHFGKDFQEITLFKNWSNGELIHTKCLF